MSFMEDPKLVMIVISVLVKQLGGRAVITQKDIDEVAFNRIIEEQEDETLTLTLETRRAAS